MPANRGRKFPHPMAGLSFYLILWGRGGLKVCICVYVAWRYLPNPPALGSNYFERFSGSPNWGVGKVSDSMEVYSPLFLIFFNIFIISLVEETVCKPNPCQNGGTCWSTEGSQTVKCVCQSGYGRTYCQTKNNSQKPFPLPQNPTKKPFIHQP